MNLEVSAIYLKKKKKKNLASGNLFFNVSRKLKSKPLILLNKMFMFIKFSR